VCTDKGMARSGGRTLDNSSLLYRIHNNPAHLTHVHSQPIVSTACIDLHLQSEKSEGLQAFCQTSKGFRLCNHASLDEAVTAVAIMAILNRNNVNDHSVLTV